MGGEDKVRSYLLDLGLSYEEVGDGTFLINTYRLLAGVGMAYVAWWSW